MAHVAAASLPPWHQAVQKPTWFVVPQNEPMLVVLVQLLQESVATSAAASPVLSVAVQTPVRKKELTQPIVEAGGASMNSVRFKTCRRLCVVSPVQLLAMIELSVKR